MTDIPDNQIIELNFTSKEDKKVMEVLTWAKEHEDAKLTDQTFGVSTLDALMESVQQAIEAGLTTDFLIRLRCRSIDDAAYARLRWQL